MIKMKQNICSIKIKMNKIKKKKSHLNKYNISKASKIKWES